MCNRIAAGHPEARAGREAAPAAIRQPIEVVLAADHPLLRNSLRVLLEGTHGVSVVGEAGDLALTRQHVFGHRPDVLVLDVRMPDGSSLETVGELRSLAPGTHIVVVGAHDEPGFARLALDLGASGYVLTDHAAEELPDAVRAAAAGETYVSASLVSR